MPVPNPNRKYSYADVLEWDESVRAEIINGELFMMAPPLTRHQFVLIELFVTIYTFLKGKPCKVIPAPFGVRLFPRDDLSDDTLVEPDITVVCDPGKIDDRGCNGAPDLIIEILSPSNKRHDQLRKFNLYLDAGVKEYWVADPEQESVQVHALRGDRYTTAVYALSREEEELPPALAKVEVASVVSSSVLPGLSIDLRDVFGPAQVTSPRSRRV
ncbi:MAG: Uma2 family endonuclease [Spirochaetaceae bacterium]|jgi:Uma2 family endonuclease|nr:Uma2 family endonuclease [Spirochaetaceae bacterium]